MFARFSSLVDLWSLFSFFLFFFHHQNKNQLCHSKCSHLPTFLRHMVYISVSYCHFHFFLVNLNARPHIPSSIRFSIFQWGISVATSALKLSWQGCLTRYHKQCSVGSQRQQPQAQMVPSAVFVILAQLIQVNSDPMLWLVTCRLQKVPVTVSYLTSNCRHEI